MGLSSLQLYGDSICLPARIKLECWSVVGDDLTGALHILESRDCHYHQLHRLLLQRSAEWFDIV